MKDYMDEFSSDEFVNTPVPEGGGSGWIPYEDPD
jgi:hypothetical protein